MPFCAAHAGGGPMQCLLTGRSILFPTVNQETFNLLGHRHDGEIVDLDR